MKTKIYEINRLFARKNKLPVYFAAKQLTESDKALYLYGQGTTETAKMNACSVCGRELTHPVSVELGVGPECGKHYWDWNAVGGYTKENVERLKKVVHQRIQIDTWLPKSVIQHVHEVEVSEDVVVPSDHKMLQPYTPTKKVSTKKAEAITFQKTGQPGIKISFPFDHATISNVKKIPGRKFHSEGREKYWSAPLGIRAVELLKKFGFEIDSQLQSFLDKSTLHVDDMKADVSIPGLNGELFPFQAKGVAFLQARNGRALIGDEMGLGKTVQALAWLQKNPQARPAILAVPASLKLNWKKEAEKWMSPDPKVQILNGTKPTTPLIGEIFVINYDILRHWVKELTATKPQALIMDEVHYLKNTKAKRTKAAKKLAKGIPHVIGLTGTPIVNRPIEILTALQMIDKTIAPDRWDFLQRYCGPKHNGFGWDFSGASNTEELHKLLTKTVMIRRKKEDVLTDLPAKLRSFLPMELNNEREYLQAEKDFIEFTRNRKGEEAAERASNAQALAEINGLKQLAVKGKLPQAVDWIKDYLASGKKLVVMAVHKFVIDAIMDEFKGRAVKVDGSVSGAARQDAVERFQTDDSIRLFVGNIKAAGVGLTLTAASTVAFLELPWTPGDLQQAEDRVHRIGQKESVSIYYLLAQDTIEEKIAYLIDKKRKILDAVLDGQATEEESLLSELMNQYQ